MTASTKPNPGLSDERSFDDFVSANWVGMVRTCCLAGLDRASAEDVSQEALVVSYARWPRIMRMDNPQGYVYRVLINGARKHLKKRSSTLGLVDVGTGADPGAAAESLDLLRNLPHDQRLVIVLRHYFGYSESQTAEILGMRLGTVKSKSSRAIARLRAELSPLGESR